MRQTGEAKNKTNPLTNQLADSMETLKHRVDENQRLKQEFVKKQPTKQVMQVRGWVLISVDAVLELSTLFRLASGLSSAVLTHPAGAGLILGVVIGAGFIIRGARALCVSESKPFRLFDFGKRADVQEARSDTPGDHGDEALNHSRSES